MAEIPTLAQLLPDTSQVRTEVLVDGAVVSESYQLVSISTRQEIDKIPSANILIVDGDPASGDFAVSSSNDFKPGKKILIKLGYPQGLFKVFEGVILSSAVRIKDDGSELNLEAKDETYKMTLNRGITISTINPIPTLRNSCCNPTASPTRMFQVQPRCINNWFSQASPTGISLSAGLMQRG
jgi:hypothetical protein